MSLSTIFPPVPKTVWLPGDADIRRLIGFMEGERLFVNGLAGLTLRGPGIALDGGLYGVEFQFSLDRDDLPADCVIAQAQVTSGSGAAMLAERPITAGQLAAEFGGMYQGARLDVVTEQPADDVEFRVVSTGKSAFYVRGIKLVPRPGQVWFPRDMTRDQASWRISADRSATSSGMDSIAAPAINLATGEHRLGVKLKPREGMTTGAIASIQVRGRPAGSDPGAPLEVIAAEPTITAEAMLANFGVPDAKLRFRLAEHFQDVSIEVRALAPGLTVQWVRLATADEAVWHHYYNLGGTRSALGRPTGGFVSLGQSSGGLYGSRRSFEGGDIYWTIEHGPCEVWGRIARRYEERGGYAGELGFPTGRPKTSGGEISQAFEGAILHGEDR